LETCASDLNPVAALIDKAMIEIPPEFAGKPPVNQEAPVSLPGSAGVPPAGGATSASSPWYSRGYLPHFDRPDILQSITFRLHDAVPEHVVQRWKTELNWVEKLPATDPQEVELRKRIAKYEDSGHGSCWLRDERIAILVEHALLHFDGQRYRLIAWCIMPNHVHVLVETREGWLLDGILHSWKSYTAHEANKLLDRSGELWFREYYDRFIRNAEHFANAIEYIESNPVKAGLVGTKKAWRWSSARRRWKDGGEKEAAGTAALPGFRGGILI
jgi:REP element-mobilizing transposase RayT